MPEQLQFPFASLDFPGCTLLRAQQVSEKLGVTVQHVLDLIEEGKLLALNLSGADNKSGRRCIRIPIESYRNYVVACLTSPAERMRLLADLPVASRRELIRELQASLSRPAVMPATAANTCGTPRRAQAQTPIMAQSGPGGNLF